MLVLLLSLVASAFAAGGTSYNYKQGAVDWNTMGVCGTGKEQSPIDIPDDTYDVADDEELLVRASFNSIGSSSIKAEFTDTTF
jgi:carbonic anhydrase